MTQAVQTILSINEDELFQETSTQKYKLGRVYNVVDSASPLISNKYIYMRAAETVPAFEPMVIRNGLAALNEFEGVTTTTFGTLGVPGVFTAIPQIAVGGNRFAFFLLEGKGKGAVTAAHAQGIYLKLTSAQNNFIEGDSSGLAYGNDTRAAVAIAIGGRYRCHPAKQLCLFPFGGIRKSTDRTCRYTIGWSVLYIRWWGFVFPATN